MSTSGISLGGSGFSLQSLQQRLFGQIDSNADGSITKTEMESAVTGAGGTTEAADALFSSLDRSGSGSVSNDQFVSGLQSNLLSDSMMSQLIGLQSDGGMSGAQSFASDLFSSIDADADGAITQSELETAVTDAGGTTEEADALWKKLTAGNEDSDSISEAQFAQAMMPPPPPMPSSDGTDSTDSSSDDGVSATSSTSASSTDAAASALKYLLEALDKTDTGSDDSSSSTASSNQDSAASDAFRALLETMRSGTSPSSDSKANQESGTLAASAMQELLNSYLQSLSSGSAASGSVVSTTA